MFGGLGDPSRTLSETILGPFLAPNRPKKIDFGDVHDHWVDVWVQGAFATVFRVVLNPDYDFSDRLGIRERRELWLGSSVAKSIHTKNTPGKSQFSTR